MKFPDRSCNECGTTFEPAVRGAEFCSTRCRSRFNKRRRDRGTELYDVAMAAMFDEGGKGPPQDMVQKLLVTYRAADHSKRNSRPSWQSWKKAQLRIPMAYSKEGDRR